MVLRLIFTKSYAPTPMPLTLALQSTKIAIVSDISSC
jgi:hypothetical protein